MAEQRYRVVERLEAGGMAEVFLGEAVSLQGFKKQVAIKRVLPHLAQNRSFISMFLDEARLGARLNHTNIVSVLDIGAADNTYFIVMEFIDGGNMKTVLETLKDQGERIDPKLALYIAMEVCRGLSYAHEVADEEGQPLNIVHRDISPPNILMTKRGEVKVTDFGLAKATTQLEKTDPGVVKGKFSYLAPEAAMGEPVDARADLFAVGIVTWEALAGRRLFLSDSDYETVKRVQKAEVPSIRNFNDRVDRELEGLLNKALARDRNQRFESARQFGDAIADYLFSRQMKVTSYDLAALMGRVLQEKRRQQKFAQPEVSIIQQLIQEELLAFTSLDDMHDPLGPTTMSSSSPPPPAAGAPLGAMPLDAGTFTDSLEDPGAWFKNDHEVGHAVANAGGNRTTADGSEPPDLASLLEDELAPGTNQAGESGNTEQAATELDEEDKQETAPHAPVRVATPPLPVPRVTPPTMASEGGGGSKYVVLLIVLVLGAGAAAWFGNLIFH